MNIVCPSCAAINRIPEGKSHVDGTCGKCKNRLHTSSPAQLTDATFQRYIEKNALPVLVDYWASWCGPCQMMAPVFAKLASETESILFAKVDTEHAQQVSAAAGIRSIPTLVLFYAGKEVNRVSGALSEHQLRAWIAQSIKELASR
ncbi:thioredoxin TrxC [Aestuariibacter salexigens]|uniref:thioredoxin TrxC n=1 Tax=Aestuariibacter salexigens TaxID=226010 RepID=UPI00040D1467|nr:thioredoxin TrxC [Aestuariibacter salexigens]